MRIVDLKQKSGVDDGAIFLVKCIGHSENEVLVVQVILIQTVWHDAAGRDRSHERFGNVDAGKRDLQIFNVAPYRLLAAVADRPNAAPVALAADEALGLVVFGIKVRKTLAICSLGDDFAGLEPNALALLKSRKPFENVTRPACRFAELAIADDVDASVGLLANDLRYGFAQTGRMFVGSPLVAGVDRLEVSHEFGRPDQPADMRRQNFFFTALHPCFRRHPPLTKLPSAIDDERLPGHEIAVR